MIWLAVLCTLMGSGSMFIGVMIGFALCERSKESRSDEIRWD